MPLRSPMGIPERILNYGGTGTRRTSCGFDIARLAHKTGADTRFYGIDTEWSWRRILVGGTRYGSLPNLVYSCCKTFDAVMEALNEYVAVVRPQDWILLDVCSEMWPYAQTRYVQKIYRRDYADHEEVMREQLQRALATNTVPANLNDLSGYGDWKVINARYFDFRDMMFKDPPCNIYATATWKELDKKENEHNLTFYGKIGYKPEGQKDLDRQMDTIICSRYDGERWYMTSIKDRERVKMRSQEVTDFATQYLIPYGGWVLD